jgi:O-antigen ligase
MSVSMRQAVIPAYVLLCLLLGGSSQAVWGNMLLQLGGLAIIAWALAERPPERMIAPARHVLWIALAAIAIGLLQLIPLPPAVWTGMGPRQAIAEGYSILGLGLPPLPISLTPHQTIDALLSAIPPLAILLGMVRLKAFRGAYLAAAIIAAAVLGIGLSALQISSAQSGGAPWYLYPVTNIGFGVGFFANANHMASLLLVAVPFLAATVPAARGSHIQRYSAFVAVIAGIAVLLLVGIALSRSLAGYGLLLPVGLASIAIVLPRGSRARRLLGPAAALTLVGAIAAIAATGIGANKLGAEADTAAESRLEILEPTIEITREFLPFGTGLGSFRRVYPLFEDPDAVSSTYVIHAHNDFAEWAMETGAPGIILLLLFLAWWARAVLGVWRNADSGAFARAASIASAALLAHSLVDFPLRTSGLAGVFALCVALLADRRAPQAAHAGDLRPTRHVVIR